MSEWYASPSPMREGYVHYGGVYAALGHPLASLGHGAGLGDHLEVGLPVDHVGGGLTERPVVLHEQDVVCDLRILRPLGSHS